MSFASIGYMANITHCATEGGSYTALLSEPTMIPTPSRDAPEVDATHIQSPGRTRESVPGLFKPQSFQIEGNFIKADFVALFAIEALPYWFKIESPDGYPLTLKFPGYVHKIETKFEADVVSKMTFEIVVTGEVEIV